MDSSRSSNRWTAKRKAELVESVRRGDITLSQALNDHEISLEEYSQWEKLYAQAAVKSLLRAYRESKPKPKSKPSSNRNRNLKG